MASKPDNTRDRARAQERKQRDAEVKRQAAQLKKMGLIYAKKDLRKVKVTAYMRKKVRELSPVLTGEYVSLLPPKGRKAREYKGDDDVIATPNGRVIVRNDPDSVKGFRGGRRSTVIPLGDGNTIELLELPIDGRDVDLVAEYAESGALDKMKLPREFFAIRTTGNDGVARMTYEVFPNAAALAFKLNNSNSGPRAGEPGAAQVYVYRVYPPDDWEEQAMREAGERREAAKFVKRVRKERERPNRQPRFSAEQLAEAKATRDALRRETDRLRKRAAREKTTDEQRAKNAERMRAKRKSN